MLYRLSVGPEPRTPEEIAADYDLPMDAVVEAIDYATRNQELLSAERAREETRMRRLGLDRLPHAPASDLPAE